LKELGLKVLKIENLKGSNSKKGFRVYEREKIQEKISARKGCDEKLGMKP
jgi:cytochrome c biogenesis protein ResB